MLTRPLLEQARLHVRRHFSKHMPKWMRFHDLEHTLVVTRAVVEIGQASGSSAQDLMLLELAALFHDTGYAHAYVGHEAHSVRLAKEYLEGKTSARTIARVASLILATRMSHKPRGLLQQIMRDADHAKAGQADFQEKAELLRMELQQALGEHIDRHAWRSKNLAYLEAHHFHTAYAKQRYGAQKRINLDRLYTTVEQLRPQPPAKVDVVPAGQETFFDRDLSWLSFNERVLQEAEDPRVPLLERLKFVAIHSSNLDEFYRVRVAQLRSLRKLGKRNRSALEVPPEKLIARINQTALAQQARIGALYRHILIPALRKEGIRLRSEKQLNAAQRTFISAFFKERITPLLETVSLRQANAPFIEDRKLYLIFDLAQKGKGKHRLVVMNVPTKELGRFIALPSPEGKVELTYLEDAIRYGAAQYFKKWSVKACFSVKLSRDADLYLEEEFVEKVVDKVRRSLKKRRTGVPARFLYDGAMPKAMLTQVRNLIGVHKSDLLEGGRYHNLSDLMELPVKGHPELREIPLPPMAHPALVTKDPFRALRSGDVLLHHPYHAFEGVVDLIARAATDERVSRIAITLYRVASDSQVCKALVEAAKRGKQVDVLMEVQARFDEGNNLFWGEELGKAGAHVVYGLPGYKVHAKLCLIDRAEGRGLRRYVHLGTGNFNEVTARIYGDMSLLTADREFADEVAKVMDRLMETKLPRSSTTLMLAPTALRSGLEHAIDKEIAQALIGRPASILIKLNSLEDKTLIRKLYVADRAGVKIRLIVRGICCLVPGTPGYSETIQGISIVDRYLEHARAYVFHNAGSPTVHLASADWMERNLDRRVEIAFPIRDRKLKAEVLRFLELEWRDNVKARWIDRDQTNSYRKQAKGEMAVRSQVAWYGYLKRKLKALPEG